MDKNDNLLSIIIPCYNVQRYLDDLFESLKLCDRNIEIIFVDDGSPDESGLMCESFASKRPNTFVVHKENGGLSSARNAGLAVAKGEYIWFVDSDDYIDKDIVVILDRIKKHPDIEMYCFNTRTISEDGKNIGTVKRKLNDGYCYSGLGIYNAFRYPFSAVQFYVFKHSFLTKNHLFFKDGALYDDWQFILRALALMNECCYLDVIAYNYRLRDNSISTSIATFRHMHDCVETAIDYSKLKSELGDSLSTDNKLMLTKGICSMVKDAYKLAFRKISDRTERTRSILYFFSKNIWLKSILEACDVKALFAYCLLLFRYIIHL